MSDRASDDTLLRGTQSRLIIYTILYARQLTDLLTWFGLVESSLRARRIHIVLDWLLLLLLLLEELELLIEVVLVLLVV
jgi:hypothetical protein